MAWWLLAGAGIMEVAWALGLKHTDGFTRLWPSIFTIGAMAVSFWLLSLALRSLPIGTAYAVWTGIGALGTGLIGMAVLGEPATALRLAGLGLIVGGIVMLKLAG
ncbi:MAG: multidrug efflux SMR transporter [Rubritepida sp.]|nr:multidrug efflux SMR transporter [Rubritepida sp.]